MAAIPRAYLDSVFYIYPNRDSAEKGERAGGTGFFCARRRSPSDEVFLVTNRHVVAPMAVPHIRVNCRDEAKVEVIRIPKDWWTNHPDGDDLSVAQVDLPAEKYRIAWVYEDHFLNDQIIGQENVGLGDTVAMIGRFSSHDGLFQNSPSARFGHIAMLAADPIKNDFGVMQDTFVIECFSLKGYSGSPVLWYRRTNAIQDDAILNSRAVYLMGVNWMHFEEKQSVSMTSNGSDGAFVKDHTGMSGVIPAFRLSLLLGAISGLPRPAVVN